MNITFNNLTNIDTFTDKIHGTVLLICCIIAMYINIVVLISVHWIRQPMTPVIKLSISLAAADTCSSFMYGIGICIDLVHAELFNHIGMHCELIRLSAIAITVFHLLALCLNHYISILKPLHYNAICTEHKVLFTIIFLWITPTMIVVLLCMLEVNDKFWDYILFQETNTGSMNTSFFRIGYSLLFFIPIILMTCVYTHILIIVKLQQKKWKNLSRLGSTKWRGGGKNSTCTRQRQWEGSVKALYTSLLIMGSCIIGWTPALLMFSLICEKNCYIHGDEMRQLNIQHDTLIKIIRHIENTLVIMKMFVNPIIYSIRMKEIQVSQRKITCEQIRTLLRYTILFYYFS